MTRKSLWLGVAAVLLTLSSTTSADPITLTPGSVETLFFYPSPGSTVFQARVNLILNQAGTQLTIDFQQRVLPVATYAFNLTTPAPFTSNSGGFFTLGPVSLAGLGDFNIGLTAVIEFSPSEGGVAVLTFSSPLPQGLIFDRTAAVFILPNGARVAVEGTTILRAEVPEPATLLLLSLGLVGVAEGVRRRRKAG
jgi:hypothetical protein